MLYNPQWRDQDLLTLTSFIAWLELQPAEGNYNWIDPCGCAVYQYLQDKGQPLYNTDGRGHTRFTRVFGAHRYASKEIKEKASNVYHDVCGTQPWTYGAALTRARAALASVAPRG